MNENFLNKLKEWFSLHQREFPWRINRTPYAVLISEFMLQQTRASVVIPYFQKWMKIFPDLETLSKASLETVLKTWEGLGYYNRARYLYENAQIIQRDFEGKIPSEEKILKKLKGFGPYTIGALLAFGFGKKIAALDGNVLRVLARFFALAEEISLAKTKKKLQKLEESFFLKDSKPYIVAEALIELGALCCLPQKPLCETCPLREDCQAFLQNKISFLPVKTKKNTMQSLQRSVFVIEKKEKFLVQKRLSGKVMAGLYEFPYIEERVEEESLEKKLFEAFQIKAFFLKSFPLVSQTFTRFKAKLFPHYFQIHSGKTFGMWLSLEELNELPFSSGHRKILALLKENK